MRSSREVPRPGMEASSRRRFLRNVLGGAVVGLARPAFVSGLPVWQGPRDEAFWKQVKAQFPLEPGLAFFNSANLAPSSWPALDALFRWTRAVDEDPSFQNRDRFKTLREEARQKVAALVSASPEEIFFTRNTSEANNVVVSGLDLKPGDEVVIFDQNHPSNQLSWEVRARRAGFTVKKVAIPSPDAAAVISAFRAALSPATRVLALTHVTNTTGVVLPVGELCRLASDRGILTLIDGAQSFGVLQIDLRQMGADFFTASSHKWFMGPKECGILYARKERQAAVWPSIVSVGWEEKGLARLEAFGQRDDAAIAAMGVAADFISGIGMEAVESRARALSRQLLEGLARLPAVQLVTSLEPSLSSTVVTFAIEGLKPRDAFEWLYRARRIAGAAMGERGLRLSVHVFNSPEEIERTLEAVGELARHGPTGG